MPKRPFNTECPCCLEEIEQTDLSCGHGVCEGCLEKLSVSLYPHCPLCRSAIELPWVLELQGHAAYDREYYVLAFTCYQGAAEGGVVSAMNYLAFFLENGIGCPRDVASAEMWLQRAIDAGDLDATYNRGVNYFNGREYEEAQKWFTKAGLKGHHKSMKALITMHEHQVGTTSHGLADFWSRRLYPDGPERTKYAEAAQKEWDDAVSDDEL
jgi:TPR repeat protein